MRLRRSGVVLLLGFALLLLAASAVSAYPAPKWNVGDKVEAYDMYVSTWENATITVVNDYRASGSELYYKAHLDAGAPKGSSEVDLLLKETEIRPRTAFKATFKVGSAVDVYYSPGKGKDRASVIAIDSATKRYKVHYPGCTAKWDEWFDHSLVLPAKQLSRGSSSVRFLVGKWIMFTPSYPNTVITSTKIIREYGTGARTPPLTVKANGTFVWYFDYGKRPVKGRWIADARVPGADQGTAKIDGVLITDPAGNPWKVYRRIVSSDHKAHITAQRLCSGITDIGTKAGS